MDIQIRGVQKHYGSFHALRGIDLDIASGELLALLGPSGSGKTTLLRAIAGLEPLDGGQVKFGDIDATGLSVQERKVGFVFQQYALFKHMTVFDNIAFGLSVRPKKERPDTATINKRVRELLELVQLGGLEKRYPAQLSGGQKQRVALARALAIEPRVLLLDEPFGALDAKVRKDLRRWLRSLHRETGYTTIFVTHDQEEALELADRVVVMNRGVIEQVGTTDEVWDAPSTPFVYDFLGTPNVLPARVERGALLLNGATATLATAGAAPEGPVNVYTRPNELRVVGDDDTAALAGKVVETQRTGLLLRLGVKLLSSGDVIEIELPHPDPAVQRWQIGDSIRVRPSRYSLFPRAVATATEESGYDPTLTVTEHRERSRT
ncbi:sulfate/molybdate ABC transporter ATP-binding protein [uncultured Nevskia sp.]|uniref:sulfate/molybdate ABC transporter ATP-binding protein n=1 Tax=uncultured Nevskia sp. TaxID=228950 RepID=UPI0025D681A9|nr:sulfate ABC transporter ATP-binding protein [uncultured Nevskia sp.]